MLTAFSLFLIGAIQAVYALFKTWTLVVHGEYSSRGVSMSSDLKIVSTMLEAVVFYLVGVGLFSRFILPLNVAVALGIESLTDPESRIVSVIIVIMGATFLQHFVLWKDPVKILEFGLSMALVVISLIALQWLGQRASEAQKSVSLKTQNRAQHEMFHKAMEQHEVAHLEQVWTARSRNLRLISERGTQSLNVIFCMHQGEKTEERRWTGQGVLEGPWQMEPVRGCLGQRLTSH